MPSSERITLSHAEIQEARGWLEDCFEDLDADELSVDVIHQAIARHYDGGLEAFVVASGLRCEAPGLLEVVAANAPHEAEYQRIVELLHIVRQFDDAGGQVPAIWLEA